MIVKIREAIVTPNGELPSGSIVIIPDSLFNALKDKVEQVDPFSIEQVELDYFRLLVRLWEIDDDPNGTVEEGRKILAQLDVLYRESARRGQKVPVRLPIEKSAVTGAL